MIKIIVGLTAKIMSVEEKDYKFCPTCKNGLERKTIDGDNLLSCSNCGFIFWNNPKPVVSGIYVENGKILMLQRATEPLKGYWVLPGGFMKYEETPQEALKRETKEETGVDIDIYDLIGVYQIDNDPRGIHIDIIYSGTINGEIKLSNEDNKYDFFDPNKLPDKIAYKHREAIEDWAKKML